MAWKLFDAVDSVNVSRIVTWIAKEKLGKREIGALNQKLDMLEEHGTDLPPKLLAGPIKSKKDPKMVSHVWKLKIYTDRMLRPMLCKGPIDAETEFTMLLGAIEKGGVLDTDAKDAELVRLAIIANPKLRKDHERYR